MEQGAEEESALYWKTMYDSQTENLHRVQARLEATSEKLAQVTAALRTRLDRIEQLDRFDRRVRESKESKESKGAAGPSAGSSGSSGSS